MNPDVRDEILSYVCNEISDAAIGYDSVVFRWKGKYQARLVLEVEEIEDDGSVLTKDVDGA